MVEESSSRSLEYTPTWVVAVVCSIIVGISFFAERGLHQLGKFLKKKKQIPLFDALEKLKEELMLLGFISLILAVSQGLISRLCIPSHLASFMLPCKLSTENVEHYSYPYSYNSFHQTPLNNNWPRRHLLSGGSAGSHHCTRKGKVPLLSMEAVHQLHIFIFVLAAVHVFFCVTTMFLAGMKIHRWGLWEQSVRQAALQSQNAPEIRHHHREFFMRRAITGHYRKLAGFRWVISFFKQFYGSVTKGDYVTLRSGFIKEHCPGSLAFDFHKYMMRTRRHDFRRIVGITWYLWLFVVVFLLLNIEGWHSYFWLSFLPLILLLLVGAKLEHIISDLAREVVEREQLQDGATPAAVKPSDEHFWFHKPSFVLYLLHFILFQNAFETAFFFWVWSSYGFKSCIMEKLIFIIPRLVIGVIVQGLCSYSTLPLCALVTLMGSKLKDGIFEDSAHAGVFDWTARSKDRAKRESSTSSQMQRLEREPFASETMSSIIEQSSTSSQMQRLEREPFASETMSSIIELSSPNLNQRLPP